MIPITVECVEQIYPDSTVVGRETFVPYLNEGFEKYKIDTPVKISAFLAQIGHESGQLRWLEEFASGDAYEGRKSLGNTQKGDGRRYKGRGLMQTTGRANYEKLSKWSGIDFVNNPEWLSLPKYAALSAFYYWDSNNLNRYATLDEKDFKTLTRRINGGLNGYQDRLRLWERAKKVLL